MAQSLKVLAGLLFQTTWIWFLVATCIVFMLYLGFFFFEIGSYYVALLVFRLRDLPASASWVLRLKAYATYREDSSVFFYFVFCLFVWLVGWLVFRDRVWRLFFLFFFKTDVLCVALAVLEFSVDQVGHWQRSTCLCLLRAGVKDLFIYLFYVYVCMYVCMYVFYVPVQMVVSHHVVAGNWT